MVETVETLISSMELAAEMDNTANESQQPAVNKIKMLTSVENAVAQTNLHKELLDAGFLGALKLWIEPLPDFSLPNVKVTTTCLLSSSAMSSTYRAFLFLFASQGLD